MELSDVEEVLSASRLCLSPLTSLPLKKMAGWSTITAMAKHQADVVAIKPQVNAQRLDGWMNVLNSIGIKGRDKRLEGAFEAECLDDATCEELWAGDDMAARIIETAPSEMLREGFDVQIPDLSPGPPAPKNVDDPSQDIPPLTNDRADRRRRDLASDVFGADGDTLSNDAKGVAESVMALIDELDVAQTFVEAMQTARCFGGAAIFVGARDGATDMRLPLNLNKLESIDWIKVLSKREIWPIRHYRDPKKASYGEPQVYRVRQDISGGKALEELDVHESRIIRFDGVRTSRRRQRANRGWGDSVLVRVNGVLRDFQTSWGGAALLLGEFAQAIMKVKNLAQLIAANEDDVVIKRAQLISLSKSIANMLVIDSEEEFKRETVSLAGFPEMLDKFALRLAAAARMPVCILMGQSPAGLNATGDSDIRWWYDSIAAERQKALRPKLNRFLKLLFLCKHGPTNGVEPANWNVKWPALWQLTELEEADLREKQSRTDKNYIDAGVLLPDEVAVSRFGGDGYSTETVLDRRVRDAFDAQSAANAEAAHEAAAITAAAQKVPPIDSTHPPAPLIP